MEEAIATKELKKEKNSGEKLYKFFIYLVLILLAICIVVPVAWVFMASIKQNSEFYGNPWSLPLGFYWQNFVDAWETADMGDYMLNSVFVTALSLLGSSSSVASFSTRCLWPACS